MSDQLESEPTLSAEQMVEALDALRPHQMAHLKEIDSPMWESWDLAVSLHNVLGLTTPSTPSEHTDLHLAFETLRGYYVECQERGNRTPEHVWRDRLRAILPFAERDVDELCKLAEDSVEVEKAAGYHCVVENSYNLLHPYEAETRDEKFDQILERLTPLNER